MIDLIPAHPSMARRIELQDAQAPLGCAPADIELCIRSGVALACVRDGKLLAIGGLAHRWEGCGTVWGLLSHSIGATMVPIHRIVRRGLELSTYDRIEAHVADDHAEGHRWLLRLGFEREGLMRKFHAGRDYALYARVR